MKKINIKNNKNELFLNLIIQKNNERNTKRFFTQFGVFLITCLFASIITIFADSNPDANDDENDNIRECQIEITLPSALPASDGVAFKDEKKYTVGIAKFKCTKCNKEGIATPSKNEVGGGIKHYTGDIFWTATCNEGEITERKNYDFWVYKIKGDPLTFIQKGTRKSKSGVLSVVGDSSISTIGNIENLGTPFAATGLVWRMTGSNQHEEKAMLTANFNVKSKIPSKNYLENISPNNYSFNFDTENFSMDVYPSVEKSISLSGIEFSDAIKSFVGDYIGGYLIDKVSDVIDYEAIKLDYTNSWREKDDNEVIYCYNAISNSPVLSVSASSNIADKLLLFQLIKELTDNGVSLSASISGNLSANLSISQTIESFTTKARIIGSITAMVSGNIENIDNVVRNGSIECITEITVKPSIAKNGNKINLFGYVSCSGLTAHFTADEWFDKRNYKDSFSIIDAKSSSISASFEIEETL